MDFGFLTDNVGAIFTVATTVGTALGGTYVVKVKRAVKSLQSAIKEGQDVLVVNQAALADGKVTKAESQEIGKEIQEFMVSLQVAAADVSAILPKKIKAHIPIEFSR